MEKREEGLLYFQDHKRYAKPRKKISNSVQSTHHSSPQSGGQHGGQAGGRGEEGEAGYGGRNSWQWHA